MQRLHQDDLVGYVQEQGGDWEIVRFPAIAEENECHLIETPLGSHQYHRQASEVLNSERESLETLARVRQEARMLMSNRSPCFPTELQPSEEQIAHSTSQGLLISDTGI